MRPALLVEAADKRDEILTCALWVPRAAQGGYSIAARIGVVVPGVARVRSEIEGCFARCSRRRRWPSAHASCRFRSNFVGGSTRQNADGPSRVIAFAMDE